MEEMVNNKNQAGRLYKILSDAVKLPDGMPTIDMWANVLGVEPQNRTLVFMQYSMLQNLSDDVKRKISGMDGVNSKLLLSQHSNIDQAIKAANLDAGWSNYKHLLSPAVMLNLAHCADALSRYDEKPIDMEELASLDADIAELFNKVADGSIDPTLRDIILDLLEAVRRSISEYKIRGASGIRDQLAYCLGKVFYNKDLFTNNTDIEEVVSWWKIFARADNMTTVALNLVSIGTSVINLMAIAHK
ncbi:MAG: hypothetical protein JZU65_06965 [Chlorobium sp.]|nr:hypothetical protein [Chlorobium sp.]